ncbi:unnamed protein product, partial [Urochloa humidicola]
SDFLSPLLGSKGGGEEEAALETGLSELTCCARRPARAGSGAASPTPRRPSRAGPGGWEARWRRTVTIAVGFEAADVRSVAGAAADPKNPSRCKEPSGRGKSHYGQRHEYKRSKIEGESGLRPW